MATIILTDQNRSVLFCTTSERALPHEAFIGRDSLAQAEDFLNWVDGDPRRHDATTLAGLMDTWIASAFDEDGHFVGTEP